MHIPKFKKTSCIEIESFDVSLENALKANEKYDINKWLYVPNTYSEYRYILGTRGQNPLICIGINPSTAEPDNLDNTLKSVERIASFNGFDSFIMFNIYAQRATNPDDMEKEFNEYLHLENIKAFEYILSLYGKEYTPSVWAAWGTIIEKREYLLSCLNDFIKTGEKYNANWYSVGKISAKGHPHHPLYLKKDSVIECFDIKAYIK